MEQNFARTFLPWYCCTVLPKDYCSARSAAAELMAGALSTTVGGTAGTSVHQNRLAQTVPTLDWGHVQATNDAGAWVMVRGDAKGGTRGS